MHRKGPPEGDSHSTFRLGSPKPCEPQSQSPAPRAFKPLGGGGRQLVQRTQPVRAQEPPALPPQQCRGVGWQVLSCRNPARPCCPCKDRGKQGLGWFQKHSDRPPPGSPPSAHPWATTSIRSSGLRRNS